MSSAEGLTMVRDAPTGSLIPAPPAPCSSACPAGVNVQGYVGLISQGRFREALEVVRQRLPFPGICGRVCPAPCESACGRIPHGGAIAVRALKRFVADRGRGDVVEWDVPPISQPEKIAVVGAGPAGLTAALELRRAGYPVTLFESGGEPGGQLIQTLPGFRLPSDVVREEVEAVVRAVGDMRKGVRIGKDVTIAQLFEQGYAAVLVAIGACVAMNMGVPGEDAVGVTDALSYLSGETLQQPARKMLVIGGGSTAMDVARSAIRRGWNDVQLLYRRTRAEMPAASEEVEHALEEGVVLQTQVVPLRVVSEGGRVVGLECQRTQLGEPDASGRRRPVVISGSEFVIDTDNIVVAVGQKADASVFGTDAVELDPLSLQTANAKVFAAGDAATGPATVIRAVATGRRAARSVASFLRTGKASGDPDGHYKRLVSQIDAAPQVAARMTLPMVEAEERKANFAEAELCMGEEAALDESSRCMRCGGCNYCSHCSSDCPWRLTALDTHEFARVARALFEADVAGARLAVDGVVATSLLARVHSAVCRGCGTCVSVCDFHAPALIPGPGGVAEIDPALCRGCGICVAECPSGAIDGGPLDDAALIPEIRAVPVGTPIRLRCNWCTSEAAEGTAEVRVLCAGRITAGLVVEALDRSGGQVSVATCADDGCRYGQGPALAVKRLAWLKSLEGERLRVEQEVSRCQP